MVNARYMRPWLLHGAIGPSYAVAHLQDWQMTVCTRSQGVYPLIEGAIVQSPLSAERLKAAIGV